MSEERAKVLHKGLAEIQRSWWQESDKITKVILAVQIVVGVLWGLLYYKDVTFTLFLCWLLTLVASALGQGFMRSEGEEKLRLARRAVACLSNDHDRLSSRYGRYAESLAPDPDKERIEPVG